MALRQRNDWYSVRFGQQSNTRVLNLPGVIGQVQNDMRAVFQSNSYGEFYNKSRRVRPCPGAQCHVFFTPEDKYRGKRTWIGDLEERELAEEQARKAKAEMNEKQDDEYMRLRPIPRQDYKQSQSSRKQQPQRAKEANIPNSNDIPSDERKDKGKGKKRRQSLLEKDRTSDQASKRRKETENASSVQPPPLTAAQRRDLRWAKRLAPRRMRTRSKRPEPVALHPRRDRVFVWRENYNRYIVTSHETYEQEYAWGTLYPIPPILQPHERLDGRMSLEHDPKYGFNLRPQPGRSDQPTPTKRQEEVDEQHEFMDGSWR